MWTLEALTNYGVLVVISAAVIYVAVDWWMRVQRPKMIAKQETEIQGYKNDLDEQKRRAQLAEEKERAAIEAIQTQSQMLVKMGDVLEKHEKAMTSTNEAVKVNQTILAEILTEVKKEA